MQMVADPSVVQPEDFPVSQYLLTTPPAMIIKLNDKKLSGVTCSGFTPIILTIHEEMAGMKISINILLYDI